MRSAKGDFFGAFEEALLDVVGGSGGDGEEGGDDAVGGGGGVSAASTLTLEPEPLTAGSPSFLFPSLPFTTASRFFILSASFAIEREAMESRWFVRVASMFKDAAPIPWAGVLKSERRLEQLIFHSLVVIERRESTSSSVTVESDVFDLRRSVIFSALDICTIRICNSCGSNPRKSPDTYFLRYAMSRVQRSIVVGQNKFMEPFKRRRHAAARSSSDGGSMEHCKRSVLSLSVCFFFRKVMAIRGSVFVRSWCKLAVRIFIVERIMEKVAVLASIGFFLSVR
mmetsp:Transcript_13908/g.28457  ORF Transcript_13908/g.28457 Transcript_13908/m.28457 type:complete len:282 (-) Transcript_13908:647-1492(-)